MIDRELRPLEDRLVAPLASRLAPVVAAGPVTVAGLIAGVGAAFAAAGGLVVVSLVLWFVNRFLDGLDGAIARRRGGGTDLGGYVDIVTDMVVYAAIPLGVAAALGTRSAWAAAAVLLAAFYVNAISWSYLAALLEKRGSGAGTSGEMTSVRMPRGLVEGAETIVLYAVMLALPGRFVEVAAVMTGLVVLTVAQRSIAARRQLGH